MKVFEGLMKSVEIDFWYTGARRHEQGVAFVLMYLEFAKTANLLRRNSREVEDVEGELSYVHLEESVGAHVPV
jgi:hypothetical protein